jgi:hypothetical protein
LIRRRKVPGGNIDEGTRRVVVSPLFRCNVPGGNIDAGTRRVDTEVVSGRDDFGLSRLGRLGLARLACWRRLRLRLGDSSWRYVAKIDQLVWLLGGCFSSWLSRRRLARFLIIRGVVEISGVAKL